MFCTKCGHAYEPKAGMKFCSVCGAPIQEGTQASGASAPAPGAEAEENAYIPKRMQVTPTQSQSSSSASSGSYQPKAQSSSSASSGSYAQRPRSQAGGYAPSGNAQQRPQTNSAAFSGSAQPRPQVSGEDREKSEDAGKKARTAKEVYYTLRQLATSPMFLAAAIAASVGVFLRLIRSFLTGSSLLSFLGGFVGGLGIFRFTSIVSALISVVCIVGIWLVFAACSGAADRSVGNAGFLLIKIIQIINFVVFCIVMTVVIFGGVFLMGGASYFLYDYFSFFNYTAAGNAATLIMFGIVAVLVVVLGLGIFLYRNVLSILKTMKTTLGTGEPSANISRFVPVMFIIYGSCTIFSGVITKNPLTIINSLCSGAGSILLSVFLFTYRTRMLALVEGHEVPETGNAQGQTTVAAAVAAAQAGRAASQNQYGRASASAQSQSQRTASAKTAQAQSPYGSTASQYQNQYGRASVSSKPQGTAQAQSQYGRSSAQTQGQNRYGRSSASAQGQSQRTASAGTGQRYAQSAAQRPSQPASGYPNQQRSQPAPVRAPQAAAAAAAAAGTAAYMPKMGETVVLKQSGPMLYMTQVKTGNRFPVSHSPFRIGKDPSEVDFLVHDNPAVSRKHGELIHRSGVWYIKDLNSTNHVYINGAQLAPNVEVPIVDGDSLRLGDETFKVEFQ